MIRQRIYIEEYDIVVYCYYALTCYYTEEILNKLYQVGANDNVIMRAQDNLDKCSLDTGLSFYSPLSKMGVLVVARTSSAEEFYNSLTHELWHLTSYISKAEGINPFGEKAAYLMGGLARDVFPKVEHLLCNCCRKKKEGR
jgi:hypothetical protein